MNAARSARRAVGLPALAALVAAVFSFAVAPARAQEMDPDVARARELVMRIRKAMRDIDSLLLEGAQPASIERQLAENQKRIEELLKQTESRSQDVIHQIDELIKLSKYRKSHQQPPPQGSPQSGEDPSQGKQQPKRPKSQEQDLSQQPQHPEGQQPQESKPEPRDGDPKDGKPDPSDPAQRDATRPPPKSPTGEFERVDTSGRWGVLPPKEAEDLQRRNADEFPQRYRQWMELYFRRVNRLPARDR
jgi:hypothetical protein